MLKYYNINTVYGITFKYVGKLKRFLHFINFSNDYVSGRFMHHDMTSDVKLMGTFIPPLSD